MMVDQEPIIAVLMPNYNNGKYLLGAVSSIRAQSYSNWVAVIIDDGSTDDSLKILMELENDSRIHVLRNDCNMGVAFSRKRMIEETDCEYMCFLDPDDELTPNALEDHIRIHTEHPEVSIVFSRHFQCDKDLSIIEESRRLRIPEGGSYFTLKDFREEHLVSFKKSYYNRTAGMNPSYKLAEDTFFNVMMEEVGKPFCLDSICYKYRRNGNSLTKDYSRHMFWNMLVQYDTCKRRGLDVESQLYDWYTKAVEYASRERIFHKELEVRQSSAYKLGSFILSPIRVLRSLIHG